MLTVTKAVESTVTTLVEGCVTVTVSELKVRRKAGGSAIVGLKDIPGVTTEVLVEVTVVDPSIDVVAVIVLVDVGPGARQVQKSLTTVCAIPTSARVSGKCQSSGKVDENVEGMLPAIFTSRASNGTVVGTARFFPGTGLVVVTVIVVSWMKVDTDVLKKFSFR
jgi:hypothetical protein